MAELLIGLCGKKGSGKTFVAEHLRDDKGATILRFADTLKAMMRVMGLTESQIDGNQKETPSHILNGNTPRYAMQTLGTEWGRETIYQNIWVNILIEKSKSVDGLVVCDDVRFPNEIKAIHEQGGIVAWVERKSIYAQGDTHSSETSINSNHCDVIVDNTRDIHVVASNILGWADLQQQLTRKKLI